MGGSGSTRWEEHQLRPLADECESLDIRQIVKGIVPEYSLTQIIYRKAVAQIDLRYWYMEEKVIAYVRLTSTSCTYGGVRWWALCPSCERRCAKLYKRVKDRHYGCQVCQGVTYKSSRISHLFDRGTFAKIPGRVVEKEKFRLQLRLMTQYLRTRPGSKHHLKLKARLDKLPSEPFDDAFREWVSENVLLKLQGQHEERGE